MEEKKCKLLDAMKDLVYLVIICGLYFILEILVSWFLASNIVIPTVGLTFVVATGLYWYSGKGAKYMYTWPTFALLICLLLGAFQKLAS